MQKQLTTLAFAFAATAMSQAAIVAQTGFETTDGFAAGNNQTLGFDVTTPDGSRWIAGNPGQYAGTWAGQARSGSQSVVIGNGNRTNQFLTIDPAGAGGVDSFTFHWDNYSSTNGNLLVQWTTDTLDGNEAWNTAETILLTGGGEPGWDEENITIGEAGDVKLRLLLPAGTTRGASFDDIVVTDFTPDNIPEPTSTALLGIAGLGLLLRRRK